MQMLEKCIFSIKIIITIVKVSFQMYYTIVMPQLQLQMWSDVTVPLKIQRIRSPGFLVLDLVWLSIHAGRFSLGQTRQLRFYSRALSIHKLAVLKIQDGKLLLQPPISITPNRKAPSPPPPFHSQDEKKKKI